VVEATRVREPVEHGARATHQALATLRRGREAVQEVEGQLDSMLVQLRDPSGRIDPAAPERLARASRKAHHAISDLVGLGRLF
jgi:hypothetical protein